MLQSSRHCLKRASRRLQGRRIARDLRPRWPLDSQPQCLPVFEAISNSLTQVNEYSTVGPISGLRSCTNTPRTGIRAQTNRTLASAAAAAQRLAGKTILITGASSGIGRSTALELARTCPSGDLRLILAARRSGALAELSEQIASEAGAGVKVRCAPLDMRKAAEVRSFIPNLPQEWRDINILINNAGLVKGVARAPEIEEEDMAVMFETNVTGLINMTQAVLPTFKARQHGGKGDIVNIGSIAGREPYPGGSIYCASKAAVRSFTRSLRKELIATRIRVVEVDPGQVETEFSLVRFGGDEAKARAVYARCEPLTPEDIAEVIVFTLTRRENVVVADTLVLPNRQASALIMHRNED